jgi:hypothetical protein
MQLPVAALNRQRRIHGVSQWRSHVSVRVRDALGTIAAIKERLRTFLLPSLIYKNVAYLADKAARIVISDAVQGADAPNQLLAPRSLRGSASYFIGLQNAHASFGGRRCEPNFSLTSILDIGRHLGSADGNALTPRCIPHGCSCSCSLWKQ